MTVKSGIIEEVEMMKETTFGDGGLAGSVEFGYIKKLSWSADANTTANYSADGDHKPNTLTDGVLSFTGSLDWDLTDGRELECIFGKLTDAGSGTFTLATANVLPSYGFYGILDSANNAQGLGFKFSKVTITGSRNNKITVSADILGQNVETSSETITPQTPTVKQFVDLDAKVTIDGGKAVDLEDFSIIIDRACEGRRGIEDVSTDERRLITSIIEKNLSVSGSATAIAKKEIFEAILGGTTIEDHRKPSNIVLTIGNDTNTLVLTINGLVTVGNRDSGAEDDLVTFSFDLLGKSIAGSGTYTA